MYINIISDIVGSRPVYNDRLANGRRNRKWYGVSPDAAVRVMHALVNCNAQHDAAGGRYNTGFEIKYHGTRLEVKMTDGADQRKIDAQKQPRPIG